MTTGRFFSLDGIDGTGKSTQCRLLADWLQAHGHAVVTCVDPGGTPLGAEIRTLLLGHRHQMSLTCEMFLFMASRSQLVAEIVRPALLSGEIVIADRYLLANVVYQGHAGGLDVEQLWSVGRLATGGVEPELILVLDLPVARASDRLKPMADRVESRPGDYHERVRQGFLTEAQRQPERIRVVDADGTIEEVQDRLRQEVARVLAAGSRA